MSEPMVKNASDESQVREAYKKEKLKREIELDDLEFILKQPQGRRFLRKFIGWCGIFRDGFDSNNSVHCHTAGVRTAGLKLWNECETANHKLAKEMLIGE